MVSATKLNPRGNSSCCCDAKVVRINILHSTSLPGFSAFRQPFEGVYVLTQAAGKYFLKNFELFIS